MRLLFARHGESEANVRRVIANRGAGHPLTERGRAQAAELADGVRAEAVTRIVSSPSRRAAETAKVVRRVLRLPVELAEELREFDCGVYQGRSDADAWAAHAHVQSRWLAGQPEARLAGGESLIDLKDRFIPFVEGLAASDARHDEVVLLIGHGGLFLAVLPEILIGIHPAVARERGLGHGRVIVAEHQSVGRLTCVDWPDDARSAQGPPVQRETESRHRC